MAQLGVDLAASLATHRSSEPSAISCYVDLDPSTIPTASGLASHITSIGDGLKRTATRMSRGETHAHAKHLRHDAERIASYLETRLDRTGARGLALYVAGEAGVWEEARLPERVDDAVHVGRTFVLAPLVAILEHDREVLVVAVDRDRGTLWRLRQGQVSTVEDLSRHGHGQHDQGGWSQARYQRSIENDALEHMRRVAGATSHRIRPGSGTLLVVACPEEHRNVFDGMLAPHARDAVLGFIEFEKQDDAEKLRPRAERLLEAHLRAERELLVERWREEAGHEGGRAATTWEEVLAAAWDGRIEEVVLDGRSKPAYECSTCGRGYTRPGRCDLDSAMLEEALGGALELALRGTLLHGGTIRFASSEGLPETDGALALLRYATRSASSAAVSGRTP
jgi:peptide chain release factor subunit 1